MRSRGATHGRPRSATRCRLRIATTAALTRKRIPNGRRMLGATIFSLRICPRSRSGVLGPVSAGNADVSSASGPGRIIPDIGRQPAFIALQAQCGRNVRGPINRLSRVTRVAASGRLFGQNFSTLIAINSGTRYSTTRIDLILSSQILRCHDLSQINDSPTRPGA